MSTTTDLVRTDPTAGQAVTLRASLDYAQALAQSNLLPAQYRGRPANVLWAWEYGRTINLTPMAAMIGVHVIEGKPTASAGLISGLVRRAGHRLRVRGDATTAVAEIVRCDDPDFTFRSEWTLERARTAGLANKDVWQKYPAAMLKARAVAECARDACEEVLFGLHYTPEELGAEVNEEGEVIASPAPVMASADSAARETAEQDVARQWQEYAHNEARKATASSQLDDLRAPFKTAPKDVLDADVSDVVTGPERTAVLMFDDRVLTDGPLQLRTWLVGCAAHLDQGGGMSVAEAIAAGEEVVEVEPEDAHGATP